MKSRTFVVAASAVLFGFAVQAATYSDDRDLGTNPIVETLAEGAANVYSGVLSGTGGVTLSSPSATTMGGAIHLSGNNTFSGGVTVNGGTVFAEHANALGTGSVTLKAATANSTAGLVLAADNATITNSITFSGGFGAYTTPDLRFAGDNITYKGPITVSTKAYIEVVGGTAENPTEVTIESPALVDAQKTIYLKIGENEAGTAKLHWKTRLGSSATGAYTLSMGTTLAYGQLLIYSQNNELQKFNMGYASVVCMAKNVFGTQNSRACCLDCGQAVSSDQYGYFDLNGYDQCASYLGLNKSSDKNFGPARIGPEITSKSGPATLRLYRNTDDENVTSFALAGQVSILLDGKSKISSRWAKQYFANRTHSTSGDLIVSNGTLGVTMATTFTNLKRIIVGRRSDTYGTFDSQTTCDHAFPKLEELIVDGVFTHTGSGENIFPTDGTMSLTITENGSFSMPAGTVLKVKKAKLGATTYTTPGQTLTSADSALIPEGVTIKIPEPPEPPLVETTEDMTAKGDWTVSVGEGSTNVVKVAQTGSGKIIKKGEGRLVLETANDFTGGIDIEAGVVQVTTGGALGSGKVTIAGGTDAVSQLQFGELDPDVSGNKTVKFANEIEVLAGGDEDHCQIMFGPHDGTQNNRKYLELTGDVTSHGDLYIDLNNEWNTASKPTFTFTGRLDVEGDLYFDRLAFFVYCNGPVCADDVIQGNVKGAYKLNLKSSENRFGRISLSRGGVTCNAADVLGGAAMTYSYMASVAPVLEMSTYSQTAAYLSTSDYTTDARRKYLPSVTAKGEATLTLTGGVETATYEGFLGTETEGANHVSVRIAPTTGSFTQVFTAASHVTDGSVIVERGGAAVFRGATALPNLTGVAVSGGGTFTLDTTVPAALSALLSLSVTEGGKFAINRADALLGAGVDLNVDETAVLEIPSGATIDVLTLTFKGKGQRKGTYTKENLSCLPEGVTLNVLRSVIPESTADWTGLGADNLTTTEANWSSESDIDLTEGSMRVNLKGGNGMTYADGTAFINIANEIPFASADDQVEPFVITPKNEGDTLYLSKGFCSSQMVQVVVGGHVAPALDAVPDVKFYYSVRTIANDGIIQYTPKAYTGTSAALVLNGVTMDIPMEVEQVGNKMTMFALANTVNEINAPMKFIWYSSGLGAEENSVIRFHGGVTFPSCYTMCGPGDIVIDTKPASFSGGLIVSYNGHLTLAVPGNTVTGNNSREGVQIGTGLLEFTCDNAFGDTAQISTSATGVKSELELNATKQVIGRVNFAVTNTNNKANLNGTYPAMLEMTCKVRDKADATKVARPYCNARVTGGLGFHLNDQNGGTNVFTLAGRDFESCGDLMASAGTLELAAGATWRNGTNFVARGTGTLRFGGSRQTGKDAVLRIEDSGRVEIAAGMRLKVAECWVGNTKVVPGVYVAANLKEGPLYGRLSGGTLCVGPLGTKILVK